MKTEHAEKMRYFAPKIEKIILDNEISLVLESSPPIGPEEGYLNVPESFVNDSFKSQLA